MKEFQNIFTQCLTKITDAIKPKPVNIAVEKPDTQTLINTVAPTKFGVRTVAGRYEIIKKE